MFLLAWDLDWLQVHAVDEVVRLLRVEGPGLLQLVTNEPEATADHEQQQSGDDEAQSERKNGTCGTKGDMWTISRRHSTKADRGRTSRGNV